MAGCDPEVGTLISVRKSFGGLYTETSSVGGAFYENPSGTPNIDEVRGILQMFGLPAAATSVKVRYTLRGHNNISEGAGPEVFPDGTQEYKWQWRSTTYTGTPSTDFEPGGQTTLQDGIVTAASMNRGDARNDLGTFEFNIGVTGGTDFFMQFVNVSDEGGYTTTSPNATHVADFISGDFNQSSRIVFVGDVEVTIYGPVGSGLCHVVGPCNCLPFQPCVEEESIAASFGTAKYVTVDDGGSPSIGGSNVIPSPPFGTLQIGEWDTGRAFPGDSIHDHETRTWLIGGMSFGDPDPVAWRANFTAQAVGTAAITTVEVRVLPDSTFDWDDGETIGTLIFPAADPQTLVDCELNWLAQVTDIRHAYLVFQNVSPSGSYGTPEAEANRGDDTGDDFLVSELVLHTPLTLTAILVPAIGDCDAEPKQNQPIEDELVGYGDGTTTAFHTDFPYNPVALDITVSGIGTLVDPTDPAAMLFTFSSPPSTGSEIRATYRHLRVP